MSSLPPRVLSVTHRRRLLGLAVTAAAVFFVVAGLVQLGVATEAEWRVQRAAQAARAEQLDTPMRLISLLGTGWVLLPLTAIAALRLRRHPALARWLVVASVVAAGAANLAKLLAIRQRPNAVMWSYPSAHTFGIVVFVALLAYVLWSLGASRRSVVASLAAGATLTLAVGVSRIYLNAHWIGDVAGGFAGGLAFALAVVLLLDRCLPARAAAAASAPLGAVAG